MLVLPLQAQQKYWIYFKDKNQSIRQYNAPISRQYLDALQKYGVQIVHQSKWLNAVSCYIDRDRIDELHEASWINKIEPVGVTFRTSTYDNAKVSRVLAQLNGQALIKEGLNGSGIKIGVIDGGFLEANESKYLEYLIDNKKVIAYKDFIYPSNEFPYGGSYQNDDEHGTKVLRSIAGKIDSTFWGLASEASFYLAYTDQGDKENRGEEDNFIAAMEWMADQGVRLINASLGYSIGFDNPDENYTPEMIDGKSSALTRALNIGAEEAGLFIVISAGNDGNNNFKVLSVPADAKNVLTVGATRYQTWSKQGYSSIGTETLEYVKPEVACYSTSGTSFSAPVITGIVACMLQYDSTLSNDSIRSILFQSSHLYSAPNNYIGYGVPDSEKIVTQLKGSAVKHNFTRRVTLSDSIILNSLPEEDFVLFHKTDDRNVQQQLTDKPKKDTYIVVRPNTEVLFTTVAFKERTIEIEWP